MLVFREGRADPRWPCSDSSMVSPTEEPVECGAKPFVEGSNVALAILYVPYLRRLAFRSLSSNRLQCWCNDGGEQEMQFAETVGCQWVNVRFENADDHRIFIVVFVVLLVRCRDLLSSGCVVV